MSFVGPQPPKLHMIPNPRTLPGILKPRCSKPCSRVPHERERGKEREREGENERTREREITTGCMQTDSTALGLLALAFRRRSKKKRKKKTRRRRTQRRTKHNKKTSATKESINNHSRLAKSGRCVILTCFKCIVSITQEGKQKNVTNDRLLMDRMKLELGEPTAFDRLTLSEHIVGLVQTRQCSCTGGSRAESMRGKTIVKTSARDSLCAPGRQLAAALRQLPIL